MKPQRIAPGKIQLYGVFGFPLKHTLSPPMHQAGFDSLKLSRFYVPIELKETYFKKVMSKKKQLLLYGFNLTVPYKQTVMPYLDRISPEAKAIGAVNTVVKKNSQLWGYNTDAYGFMQSLSEGLKWKSKGKSVLVLGAGGASRACVYGLCEAGVKQITILNRTVSKARTLCRDFGMRFKKVEFVSGALKNNTSLKELISNNDLIVNTTSLGLKASDKTIVQNKFFPKAKKSQCVVDLIYSPSETPFLKIAKTKGWKTLNGLGMLLHQGSKSFEIWTGKKAPVRVMEKALTQAIKAK